MVRQRARQRPRVQVKEGPAKGTVDVAKFSTYRNIQWVAGILFGSTRYMYRIFLGFFGFRDLGATGFS
jgi:hypothetical protein